MLKTKVNSFMERTGPGKCNGEAAIATEKEDLRNVIFRYHLKYGQNINFVFNWRTRGAWSSLLISDFSQSVNNG